MKRIVTLATLSAIFWCTLAVNPSPMHAQGMTTQETIAALYTVGSQAEAESAIRALLVKSGVGTLVTDSKFSTSVVSDAQVTELAKLHLQFLKDGKGYPIVKLCSVLATAHSEMSAKAGSLSINPLDFDRALFLLQDQTRAALADPEKANSAFVISIVSEHGKVQNFAPRFDSETQLGPVEAFMFNLWNTSETVTISNSGYPTANVKICAAKCGVTAARILLTCVFFPPPADAICSGLDGAEAAFCVSDCLNGP